MFGAEALLDILAGAPRLGGRAELSRGTRIEEGSRPTWGVLQHHQVADEYVSARGRVLLQGRHCGCIGAPMRGPIETVSGISESWPRAEVGAKRHAGPIRRGAGGKMAPPERFP